MHSEWNWKNKVLLMEAEYHNTQGEFDQAASCYQESIKAARKHKFLQEEALGSQLAAIFFLERGTYKTAWSYFDHSVKCYKKWGASAVAKRVSECMRKEFGSDTVLAGRIDGFEISFDSSLGSGSSMRSSQSDNESF